MTHSLSHRLVTPDRICLMTKQAGICELDRLRNPFLLDESGSEESGVWFWFTRLKVKNEGQGEGSFLMRELAEVCDANEVNVICSINPYGSLDLENLKDFYRKFGFVEYPGDPESTMIRRAK